MSFSKFAATAALMAFAATSAVAGSINVVNHSFETLPPAGLPFGGCGAGCAYSIDAIPGWTTSGGSTGQFQPGPSSGNFNYFNSVPDGLTVAYTNGGFISQTVGATSVAGATYTLSVDVGYRKDVPDPGVVTLLVNGVPTVATGTALQNSGDWSVFTASYTALTSGGPIEVLLSSNSSQGDFDNVLLSSTGVPEPEGWLLMLTGLAMTGTFLRTRRMLSSARAV